MKQKTIIEHDGIVQQVTDGKVIVQLAEISSCSSCVVKPVCSVSGDSNKELVIDSKEQLSIGERIKVTYDESSGPKAMLLGYFLPFVLLFFVLLLVWHFTKNELLAAGMALFILMPYYLIIWLIRGHLSSVFSFNIQKLQAES